MEQSAQLPRADSAFASQFLNTYLPAAFFDPFEKQCNARLDSRSCQPLNEESLQNVDPLPCSGRLTKAFCESAALPRHCHFQRDATPSHFVHRDSDQCESHAGPQTHAKKFLSRSRSALSWR